MSNWTIKVMYVYDVYLELGRFCPVGVLGVRKSKCTVLKICKFSLALVLLKIPLV